MGKIKDLKNLIEEYNLPYELIMQKFEDKNILEDFSEDEIKKYLEELTEDRDNIYLSKEVEFSDEFETEESEITEDDVE